MGEAGDDRDHDRSGLDATGYGDAGGNEEGGDQENGDAAGAASPLLAWALAAFSVAFLVAAALFAFHARGVLGDLLEGLSPVVGIALYLVLWGTTWATTRRALAGGVLSTDGRRPTVHRIVGTGGLWGGVNGALFFLVLLAAVAAAIVLRAVALGDPSYLVLALYVAGVGAVGTAVAFAVGAALGVLFAALTTGLVRVGARLAGADGPRL